MSEEATRGPERVGALRKRRATLPDGRYLIYFTFEGGGPEPEPEATEAEPAEAETEAAEERRV